MTTFTFSFIGRQSGAIGITYAIKDSYQANDIHEAMSYLYEDYDLIRSLTVKSKGKDVTIPKNIYFKEVRSNRERKRNEKGAYC